MWPSAVTYATCLESPSFQPHQQFMDMSVAGGVDHLLRSAGFPTVGRKPASHCCRSARKASQIGVTPSAANPDPQFVDVPVSSQVDHLLRPAILPTVSR